MLTQAELEKIHADIVRLRTETMKLVGPATRTPNAERRTSNVEARQFTRETFWYPLAFASGLFATVAGLTV
jgi:hypothetical protein